MRGRGGGEHGQRARGDLRHGPGDRLQERDCQPPQPRAHRDLPRGAQVTINIFK